MGLIWTVAGSQTGDTVVGGSRKGCTPPGCGGQPRQLGMRVVVFSEVIGAARARMAKLDLDCRMPDAELLAES